jgi:hypothetical protein
MDPSVPRASRNALAALFCVLLVAAPRPVHAASLNLLWDPSPDLTVVGYVVYVGTAPGSYTQSVDVGNATSFTLANVVDGQVYYFAVASYAPGPVYGPPSPEVVGATNMPPSLTSPGNQQTKLGQAVTLQLIASDAENDPLTFSATGLPTGLKIDTRIGTIFGTPTALGSYTVKATVTDGVSSRSQTFGWTVADLPPPVTLVSPSGTLATATPTFVWKALPNVTSYRLWVNDAAAGDTAIQKDYTPTQAGCGAGTGQCTVSPGIALAQGPASWSVRASNAAGAGAWSASMSFSVPDKTLPSIKITSPTSTGSYSTTKSSVALAGTASDNVGVTKVTWVNSSGTSGTASGTTAWSFSTRLPTGINVITVTATDAAGNRSSASITISVATAGGSSRRSR